MKYIVMSVKQNKADGFSLEVPFMFPDAVVHLYMSTVAKLVCEQQWKNCEIKCISAGFFSSTALEANCYGKSESIGIKSRGERDAYLIRNSDYGSIHV